jgi:AraC family transcriptional activator of pobA
MKPSFEINSIQSLMENNPEQFGEPYFQHLFSIIWVNKGKGRQFFDSRSVPVEDNMAFWFTPGQYQVFDYSPGIDGYLISFNAEFLLLHDNNINLLLGTLDKKRAIQVSADQKNQVLTTIELIKKEYDQALSLRLEILRGYLKILLIQLNRQLEESSTIDFANRADLHCKKFLELLDKHYVTIKMVADYAKLLDLSPTYLHNAVKKVTGQSPSYHVREKIILEAKRKAIYCQASLKEISYDLGFDDLAHFSKYFRNACGMNFRDYKRSLSFQFT